MRHAIRMMIVLLSASVATAGEPPVTGLVADLQSGQPRAQARARQLLPRQGAAAVERVIPLLAHDDPVIAHAAFDVILETTNRVSVPGREADRREVTDLLMPLVEPSRPRELRIKGLRLLERLVPEGHQVQPIAAMMWEGDPILQDKARTVLERINTPNAAAALRSALAAADPAFQAAILNSLGQMRDEASLETIVTLCASDHPAVRAAAAAALAWTGNPVYLALADRVVRDADDATDLDARDARMRLLNVIETRGGNWQVAVNRYLRILRDETGVFKDAALAGLGRIGDGTCVVPILNAMKNADARTRYNAIAALRDMQGVDVARALVEAYPDVPEALRPDILEVLGEKKSPLAVPLLNEAMKSDSGPLRLAALKACSRSGLPEGLERLIATATNSESSEERQIARAGLLEIADRLRLTERKADAGRACLVVLETSDDAGERLRAIDGLAVCPVTEGYDAIMAAADDPKLQPQVARALIALAGQLAAEKDAERSLAAYRKVWTSGVSIDDAGTVISQMRELGADVDVSRLLGVIQNWHLVGPWPLGDKQQNWQADPIDVTKPDLSASYQVGDTRITWKKIRTTDNRGVVSLIQLIGAHQSCIGYAYAEIEVPREQVAVLRMGSDDGIKAWVNGQLVLDHWVDRGLAFDQEKAQVTLRNGVNTILLKIGQNAGGWEFCCRVTTPEGMPLAFEEKAQ